MQTKAFQKKILSWYAENGRHDLLWRPPAVKLRKDNTLDPYKIFISELMLQQTQVGRVLERYPLFLQQFPTVQALASARQSSVLRAWQGMGYNRRALFAHRAAREIVTKHGGLFPQSTDTLEMLPGIGRYTARAIFVFSWDRAEVMIETNIRKVFLHFFFPHRSRVDDRDVRAVIERTLPKREWRHWYWALMDYGALALQDVKNPNTRSRHYARQSRFEGSGRQVRGSIIRLLAKGPASYKKIIATVPGREGAIAPLLQQLAAEGFLKKQGGGYRLR